jgi:hypothetical protein
VSPTPKVKPLRSACARTARRTAVASVVSAASPCFAISAATKSFRFTVRSAICFWISARFEAISATYFARSSSVIFCIAAGRSAVATLASSQSLYLMASTRSQREFR